MRNSPEHIEDDIERTRSRIDARLNRLGDEISPNRILGSVFGANGNSTTELLGAVTAKARENPISALLIGAGIAGFVLKGERDRSGNDGHPTVGLNDELDRFDESGDPAERLAKKAVHLRNKAENLRDGAKESAAGVRARVEEETQALKDRTEQTRTSLTAHTKDSIAAVEKAASDVRSRSTALVHDAEEHLDSAVRHVKDQVRRAGDRADATTDWIKKNPVPAGLMALAFGAATASLLSARRSGHTRSVSEYSEKRLKENAREEGADPDTRGADRFQQLQDEAAGKKSHAVPSRKKASAKTRTPVKKPDSSVPTSNSKTPSVGTKQPTPEQSSGKLKPGTTAETE